VRPGLLQRRSLTPSLYVWILGELGKLPNTHLDLVGLGDRPRIYVLSLALVVPRLPLHMRTIFPSNYMAALLLK
jgi:hypothetical protein